ncbi:MAG TPA: hypothetical protein VHO28_05425 [Ignavibacteriales bacterium]|nr:hypothetical protein [Ignavibacteriales bacterium]
MKYLSVIMISLLILLAAAAAGYKYGEKRDVTRVDVDTVYAERIIHHKDTVINWLPKYVYVPYEHDSVITYAEVEKLDTMLVKSSDTLSLSITRYPLPHVHYNVGFDFVKHDSVKTIKETIYLQKKESFLSRFNIGIGAGLGVSKFGGKYELAPNVNISVYYKLF